MNHLLALILLLVAIAIGIFYRNRRKKTIAPDQNLDERRAILSGKVRFYQQLNPTDQLKFEQQVFSFLHKYRIVGVDLTLSEEDRVLVAASAIIPVFSFDDWEYVNLNEVLLYAGTFNKEYETEGDERNIAGMVGWGAMNRTMILSRTALHEGFENEHSKSNVGIHEFLHLIDKYDGAVDGIPEVIMSRQYTIPWLRMMHSEIRRIKTDHSDINPYGATSESEFFSVVGEYFFSQPEMFRKKHPELYKLLDRVFKTKHEGAS